MAVIVVGAFCVAPGAEARFEAAFEQKPPSGGSPAPVQEVLFGKAEAGRYLRVGVWPTQEAWEAFQTSETQRAFWDELRGWLTDDPTVDFYDLISSWRAS